MKRLILGCISLLICFNCLAGGVRIKFYKVRYGIDHRSLSVIPTVTYDGNGICLYSDATFENLEITVKSSTGQIVYHSFLTVQAGEPCYCPLENLEQGEYSVELSIKNDLYCGKFFAE